MIQDRRQVANVINTWDCFGALHCNNHQIRRNDGDKVAAKKAQCRYTLIPTRLTLSSWFLLPIGVNCRHASVVAHIESRKSVRLPKTSMVPILGQSIKMFEHT